MMDIRATIYVNTIEEMEMFLDFMRKIKAFRESIYPPPMQTGPVMAGAAVNSTARVFDSAQG